MSDNQMEGAARSVGGKIEGVVGDLTGDTKSQAEGKLKDVAGQAQQAYGDAKETAQSVGEQVYAQGDKAMKYVSDYVREEPVAVMIGVAVVGMLVGYLIGRPPHDRSVELGRFRASYRDR